MEEITEINLDELKASLGELVTSDDNNEMLESIIKLLAMPEDQFMILAPGIMQSFQQSLNNPADKIALVQALNASGTKAEDIIEAFADIERFECFT